MERRQQDQGEVWAVTPVTDVRTATELEGVPQG